MKKIINFTFIICIIALIVININNEYNDFVILIKSGTDLSESLNEYTKDNGDITIKYYNNEKELYDLLKNGKYDLIIASDKEEKKLFSNKLIIKIDKNSILNYRNIDNEYINNSDLNIPIYIVNNELFVIYTTNNNNKTNGLIDYLLRADVSASIIKNNNLKNINWAARYYL